MGEIKVSIVLPVYNAAKHLDKCILSILEQTLTDIELIIVNDGSVDNSIDIINKYASQDSRITVINSINNGVSSARNLGLQQAKGEYIGFIDADDWADKKMYEIMYSRIKETTSDFAICNVKVLYDNLSSKVRFNFTEPTQNFGDNLFLGFKNFIYFKYDNANWNKLYSREIIFQQKIRFQTNMKVWEDLVFNLCYLCFSKKAVLINDPLYNYLIHDESTMNSNRFSIVEEFNKYFENVSSFCYSNSLNELAIYFKKELKIYCFYILLPELQVKLTSQKITVGAFYKQYKKMLKELNKELVTYSFKELLNFSFFSKLLFNVRCFSILSLHKTLEYWIKRDRNNAAI